MNKQTLIKSTLSKTVLQKIMLQSIEPIIASLAQTIYVLLDAKNKTFAVVLGGLKNKSKFSVLNSKPSRNLHKQTAISRCLSKGNTVFYLVAFKIGKKA